MASGPSAPLYQADGHSLNNSDHPMNDSPFDTQTGSEKTSTIRDQENASPSKARHSRVLSGNGLSPLKILTPRESDNPSPTKASRKWSPEKRFPVKVNATVSGSTNQVEQRTITIEDAVKENKDLATALKIFEDEDSMGADEDNNTNMTRIDFGENEGPEPVEDDAAGPDDTMISTFSTFSAVPNLTMFNKIGHSPTKFANVESSYSTTRSNKASPQRTPRAPAPRESRNSTVNLLDFTEQIENFRSSYSHQVANQRRNSPDKYKSRTLNVTPKKRHSNLIDLDFELPPAPTPRSIPSITPRELESLKSSYQAEISSLKASLSGKEAEVLSLKGAVGDAEKRVGESMEELREVKIIKESLVEERETWEKRGKDMETVLQKVKDEMDRHQRDREEVEFKLEESEKRREAAEIMAQEAESKMAAMRASKSNSDSSADPNVKAPSPVKLAGPREVEIAVEKVSRELHTLYKSKHETKIAALKKSYEARWSRKVHELEAKVDELSEETERLREARDNTTSRVDPNQSIVEIVDEERKQQAIKDSAQIKELAAEIDKLKAEIKSIKEDNELLRQTLENERTEKGELVLVAEEMLRMQDLKETQRAQAQAALEAERAAWETERATLKSAKWVNTTGAGAGAGAATPEPTRPASKHQKTAAEPSSRGTMGRGSGLRAPGSAKKPRPTESRIGGPSNERKIGGGIPRPGSALAGRSTGIMSSIEKMGNYRGRGGDGRGDGRGE